jgi:DNA-binding GntR family transcriptional regulator
MESLMEAKNGRASDQAYSIIKDAILKGKLKPGEKLNKRSMATLCGVSIIPVIDALNRLESEGLVESNPYTGSRVITIDDQWVSDYYILREAIEVQIVRILSFTMGLSDAEPLLRTAEKIDNMAGKPDKFTEFNELHYGFHLGLAKMTGSQSLVEEMKRFHLFSFLVRSEAAYTAMDDMVRTQNYSHQDIIQSILKRNPEEAQKIMRLHIYRSKLDRPYWV